MFEDLFKEIRAAKDHIHVLFYIVQNDAFSEHFFQLLEEKAEEGIEVRLLLDWAGAFGLKKKTIRRLRRHNIEVSFCHVPHFPFFFYTMQERNHRKITVIDGKIGFFGGYNIGKEYIGGDPKLSPWRDYHLKLQGEGVHDLQLQFLTDWKEATKKSVKDDARFYPEIPKGQSHHRFSATEGVDLEPIFIDFINQAQKSLYIGSPYFIPSPDLFRALLAAIDRGVKLTIIVPKNSDHMLVQEASYRFFRILLKKGAVVYQFENGFFHAKILIRDDKVCDIGTANFDKRSLFLNHELNCYITDPSFVQEAKNYLLQDISQSSRLSLDTLNERNFFRSIKEILAKWLSHFL
ncbi:cardiolipin synthase [Bacillus carboniphilus]|uniref:Cardiolipin synthase n=1 Tax=Bacillus carboniphilus TaxID=86663 RepID=A0ABP3FNE0_9BACI